MGPQRDEPLASQDRLFTRPELNQVIHCVLGFRDPIDVNAFRSEITNSVMIKHPRFSSLLVTDSYGRDHWRKTLVEVDRHIIIIDSSTTVVEDEEDAVNDYLADLAVSSPLSTNKPLWEIHLLMAHKCAVFRFHHSLGDGTSIMSMISAICRKRTTNDHGHKQQSIGSLGSITSTRKSTNNGIWRILKIMWFTIIYVAEQMLRSVGILRDKRSVLSYKGKGEGKRVELWPRKLATAKFMMDDMKIVKSVVPNATINDVLHGLISSGLSRYLDILTPNGVQDNLRITGLYMVNIRAQSGLHEIAYMMKSNSPSPWGNKFGAITIPIYYCKEGVNPLEYTKRAKQIMDKKKLSYEAFFTYNMIHLLISWCGKMIATLLSYKLISNTTFIISNMVGPPEEMAMADNPIRYLRATVSNEPNAITIHMVTYAGMADLQISVAKDIVPNPKVLAKCFEDSLLQMKEVIKVASEVE